MNLTSTKRLLCILGTSALGFALAGCQSGNQGGMGENEELGGQVQSPTQVNPPGSVSPNSGPVSGNALDFGPGAMMTHQ